MKGNCNSKRLSVCMITFNDEQYLTKCIREIKEQVDEIIIIDIGSTDQTISIANEMGAVVYPYQWKQSFSDVKNYARKHAKGDWVLFLQPNEFISKEEWNTIPLYLENPNVEGYLCYLNYGLSDYMVYSPVCTMRLIRNRSIYLYEYDSFEKISDELLRNIEDADIHITNEDTSNIPWDILMRLSILEGEIQQKNRMLICSISMGLYCLIIKLLKQVWNIFHDPINKQIWIICMCLI